MANLKNQVQLIGYVGKNPEERTSSNNNKYATFSLATSDYYIDKNGVKQESTVWHNIVVWDKQAEIVMKYVTKGSLVGIQAKLVNRTNKDAQGNTKTEYALQVIELALLGSKKTETNAPALSNAGTETKVPSTKPEALVIGTEVEEHLPF